MRDPSHRPAKRKERLPGLESKPRMSVGICEYEIRLEIAELFDEPPSQGDLGDGDLHGGQQFVPLMDIEVA